MGPHTGLRKSGFSAEVEWEHCQPPGLQLSGLVWSYCNSPILFSLGGAQRKENEGGTGMEDAYGPHL